MKTEELKLSKIYLL